MNKIDYFNAFMEYNNGEDHKDLTSLDVAVYVSIWKYYNVKFGYAFPTREQIANHAYIGDKTKRRNLKPLENSIKRLEKHGFIIREKSEGRNNRYYLTIPQK